MTEPANVARLVLTGLFESDAARLQEWRRDPEILNGALGYPFPSSLAAELEWIRSFSPRGTPQNICLAVRASADDVLLAYCLLRNIDWIARVAEFGIVVGPDSRGIGVGRTSLDLVKQYATKQLALRRIWLRVVDYNSRAIDLYQSSGFEPEGRLRRHAYRDGGLHDVLLFGWEASSTR